MKKIFLSLSLMALTMTAAAIPAKPGLWKTIRLVDGTEVRAQLTGDEHGHFWRAEDGKAYAQVADADYFQMIDAQQVTAKAKARRANLQRQHRAMRKVSMGEQTHYTGKKKGIVILMNFKDTKFKSANNQAKYNDILNKENYNTSPFMGSVADYFKAQSKDKNGVSQFELDFDVVGPYTAKKNYSYYGENDSYGNDKHPDELIVEAVTAADADVNFADYDWDGDNEVDQVFVLYAGTGESDGGRANTIWPHMYTLSETNMVQTFNGVRINTYACSNEITPEGKIEGIGCFCHEFSHCMGFPDFYDTSYSGWYGTGDYDLMCGGSYNGDTYQPAGYNAYEKWMSGWLEPIELTTDVKVENLKPLSDCGDAYILYNSGNRNEYYTIENRQKTGWDASLPGKGLMIIHVDFDKTIWEENTPNTKVTQKTVNDYAAQGYTIHVNDHQRFALVRANNSNSDYSTDKELYPYGKKNSLTATSTPKGTWYNADADGQIVLQKGITEITQNSDKTMSFVFGDPSAVEPEDGVLFYESFNQCAGKGGNDGSWSGQIANATFIPDNEGWTAEKAYGADQCAKFGTSSVNGEATTPSVAINGKATLTFRAGAWNANNDGTTLNLSVDGGTIEPTEVEMAKGNFTDYNCTITATGKVKVTFAAEKLRFFLDEVKIVDDTTTGIHTFSTAAANAPIYNMAGQRVTKAQKGFFIQNGKKFFVK